MLIFLLILTFLLIKEEFISYTRCSNKQLGILNKNIFQKHNITLKKNGIIYIPCGYNSVEKELKHLRPLPYQKIFGISGCDKIVSKNNLWSILVYKYNRTDASDIMPESFLVNDHYLFKNQYKPNDVYILKKNLQRKKGLLLTNNYQQIIGSFTQGFKVIQKYNLNPLLINQRKINLRIYLLITSLNKKIKGWVHNLGKCIYTNKDYTNNNLDFETHITSVNLDMNIYNDNPFTLDQLKHYLVNNGYNPNVLFKNIDSHLFKTIAAAEPYLGKLDNIKNNLSFQLFGIDFFITNNLYPYLLEINKGPDMIPKNNMDEGLKTIVLEDIFKVIGVIHQNNVKHNFRRIF